MSEELKDLHEPSLSNTFPSEYSPNKFQNIDVIKESNTIETHEDNTAPWKSNGSSLIHEPKNDSNSQPNADKSVAKAERVENRLLLYKDKYELKKKYNSEKQSKEKLQAQNANPVINDVSNRIVSAKHKQKQKVEDRLIQQSIQMKKEKEDKIKNDQEKAKKNAMPNITESSQKIERNTNISSHLYAQQRLIDEKKEILKNKYSEERKYNYKPSVDSAKNKELADKYAERLKNKQPRPQSAYEPEHKPHVLKKSTELAKKLGTVEDRLLNPKPKQTESVRQLEHKPVINEVSEQIVAKNKQNGKTVEKWMELYELNGKKQIEREEKKKQHDEEMQDAEKCTFKPAIISATTSNNGHVHERAMKWAQEKDNKLSIKRADLQLRETEDCTFKPAIIERSDIFPQTDDIKSYKEHVEKIKTAREHRVAMQTVEDSKAGSGKVWENKTTVPVEFNLSNKNSNTQNIKSLHRPVQVKEQSNLNKFHKSYPKSDIMNKLTSKALSNGKNAVENIVIEVGGELKDSMSQLHQELMSLDI